MKNEQRPATVNDGINLKISPIGVSRIAGDDRGSLRSLPPAPGLADSRERRAGPRPLGALAPAPFVAAGFADS